MEIYLYSEDGERRIRAIQLLSSDYKLPRHDSHVSMSYCLLERLFAGGSFIQTKREASLQSSRPAVYKSCNEFLF